MDAPTYRVSAGDLVVITAPGHIDDDVAERIKKTVLEATPDVRVLVMGDGLRVETILHNSHTNVSE